VFRAAAIVCAIANATVFQINQHGSSVLLSGIDIPYSVMIYLLMAAVIISFVILTAATPTAKVLKVNIGVTVNATRELWTWPMDILRHFCWGVFHRCRKRRLVA